MTRWNHGLPGQDTNTIRAGLHTAQVTVIVRAAIRITIPPAVRTTRTGPPAALGTMIPVPLPLRMTILLILSTEMSLMIFGLEEGR